MNRKNWRRDLPGRLFLAAMLVVLLTAIFLAIWHYAIVQAEQESSVTLPPVEPLELAQSAAAIEPNRVTVLDTPMPVPPPEALPQPTPVLRYVSVQLTAEERQELAAIVFLEAANQCAEGQQAVAEVVLNRVISADFPNNVHDVLHQGKGTAVPQFSTIGNLSLATPGQAQQDAIDAALYGPSILPAEVVFFSQKGENDNVWGTIGGHVFCYPYYWEG